MRYGLFSAHPRGPPAHACVTGAKRRDPVNAFAFLGGGKIADVPGRHLLVKDGQQGWSTLSGRGRPAMAVPIDGEMDDLAFSIPDPAGLAIGKAKKFDGIVVQPFQDISVMDIAKFQISLDPFECCGAAGIGYRCGGYFEEDELTPIILLVVDPHLDAGRFPAFVPGDQKPVTNPIKQQKC